MFFASEESILSEHAIFTYLVLTQLAFFINL